MEGESGQADQITDLADRDVHFTIEIESGKDRDVLQEQLDSRNGATWVYPSMIAGDSSTTTSSDMDVDPAKGYVLDHIIRAHSKSTHEGQDETKADTWACAFQPTLPVIRSPAPTRKYEPRKSSSIVATCGGNTVCLVDCDLGKVMAKYSHMEEEEFMCLSWTTLDEEVPEDDEPSVGDGDAENAESNINAPHQQTNILAAAGTFAVRNGKSLYVKKCRCLAKFVGLDNSAVTAIGVSEKYLIAGTETGLMAQYNLFALEKVLHSIQDGGNGVIGDGKADKRKSHQGNIHMVKPEKLYPPSQEWHESAVDDIVYIPYFSSNSYRAILESLHDNGTNSAGGKGKYSRGRDGMKAKGVAAKKKQISLDDGEFVFASRESFQGEILVWDATKSTEADAELKNIFEWPIAESWTKFTVTENACSKRSTVRQNVLVAGSSDGRVVLFDLGMKPKYAKDGNIVAQKATKVSSIPTFAL
ncbi:hypothetical protein BG004_004374 [Podila humilis]|nr:hypothetical protein BG004_004374 [Podila humilis]